MGEVTPLFGARRQRLARLTAKQRGLTFLDSRHPGWTRLLTCLLSAERSSAQQRARLRRRIFPGQSRQSATSSASRLTLPAPASIHRPWLWSPPARPPSDLPQAPKTTRWGRSSVGRALEWHSRGRRFDPVRLHHWFPAAEPDPDRANKDNLLNAFFWPGRAAVRRCRQFALQTTVRQHPPARLAIRSRTRSLLQSVRAITGIPAPLRSQEAAQ